MTFQAVLTAIAANAPVWYLPESIYVSADPTPSLTTIRGTNTVGFVLLAGEKLPLHPSKLFSTEGEALAALRDYHVNEKKWAEKSIKKIDAKLSALRNGESQ